MSEDIPEDIPDLVKKYDNVEEINEVVGIWEVSIKDCPVRLKIKVIKIPTVPNAPFVGMANYEIQNPDQFDSYLSLRNCSSVKEAFEDALKGFLAYYKPELREKTKFVPVEYW